MGRITVAAPRLVILHRLVIASLTARLTLALVTATAGVADEPSPGPDARDSASETAAATPSAAAEPPSSREVAGDAEPTGPSEPRSSHDITGDAEPPSSQDDSGGAEPTGPSESSEVADQDAPPRRRFMVGLEGLVVQAPALRSDAVRFDPRFIGRNVSLAGLGVLGRLRVHPRIAVEATVRSGSVRYAGRETDEQDDVVSQDQVMADLGVLLFVARGELAHLAFDAGIGGMGTRVKYELDREGTQLFGSGLVRVGADVEFLVKRIAFVVSVRGYGAFTDRDRARNRGPLLQGKTLRSPVPTLSTMLVGSAGVAYRF